MVIVAEIFTVHNLTKSVKILVDRFESPTVFDIIIRHLRTKWPPFPFFAQLFFSLVLFPTDV
jgi:hypothetical protein